jgi:hypothetical protein
MTRFAWIGLLLIFSPAPEATADVPLGSDSIVVFAPVEQGRELLGRRDDYVRGLSPFDRAARMKTDRVVGEEEFLAYVTEQVAAWTAEEQARIEHAVVAVREVLAPFALNFPKVVYFVKTTGKEEGDAAYTRGSAVVLPAGILNARPSRLERLVAHELLHVLTRHDAALRDRLYQTIGFRKCNEIEIPEVLRSRKITNPDAPRNDHYVEVTSQGDTVHVVPILLASTERYDVNRGGRLFDYLTFRLLRITKGDGGCWEPMYQGDNPVLLQIGDVSGFYEQVGRNTAYIIHPEEIIAENFALLATRANNVQSPRILEKVTEALRRNKRVSKPGPAAESP